MAITTRTWTEERSEHTGRCDICGKTHSVGSTVATQHDACHGVGVLYKKHGLAPAVAFYVARVHIGNQTKERIVCSECFGKMKAVYFHEEKRDAQVQEAEQAQDAQA